MAEKIKLVQGDTRPQIQVTLTDDTSGAPIDITGATCRMYFRAVGSTTLVDTLIGAVSNGPAGVVVFAWNQNTLSVDAGDYEGEIEVTFPAGQGKQTVYDVLKFKVREDF
ncbi:MAG: hypothetical protein RL745_981 [Actinomycetota bacterium]|jgi:hypothetical protein